MFDLFKQNRSSSSTVEDSSATENNSLLHKSQPNVEFYGSTAANANKTPQRNLSSGVSNSSTDSLSGPYPAAVVFVLLSKLFEAFAANGVRSILALYFRDSLRFDEGYSTSLLHTFNFFSQFLPILGAILADSYLGNAKTIFIFYIPYAIGYVGTFLGTLPFATHLLIYSSLFLVAIGNGCLRACITALGGHQFKLPEQKRLLDKYFSLYYFCYYFGILLGKIVPAYFRTEVTIMDFCKVGDECYPAVFGLILVVFMISWLIFVFGYSYYKREHVTGDNTMLKTIGCVGYAVVQRVRGRSTGVPWLNASIGKYSETFVNDVSIFLRVITLFLPIPVYYALLAQQDSSWTYQATQTNTMIGSVRIQADQFKAIGPVLLLILIPSWQKIVLPTFEKFDIHITSLESVSIGGLCAAFSFVWAGFFQHKIHEFKDESLSIMWQFPMFFLIMMAEVLISVPGLQFCYTHAPSSMKSVLTAVWFINNALGNLIVVFISQLRLTSNRSVEFFFYAFLMFVATIIFTTLSGNFENENMRRGFSDEQVIENYIYVDEVQSTNLEENFIDDDSESFQSAADSDKEKLVFY